MAWPTPTKRTLSLGWALVDLIEAELKVPTGLGAGVPLRLTDEQVDLIVAWYQVDRRGNWVYRRGAWRLPKKWGKSPLAAAVCYCELVGPVVFSHFENGQPIGKPHPAPRVQVAACSEDQTDNTYMALFEMLRDNPVVAERGLDVGLTRICFKNASGIIEPVTSAATSREGNPVTFVLMDETQHWKQANGGKELAATIRRNAAPLGYRTLETSNAYAPGEDSVAENTAKAASKLDSVLYVAREAPKVDITDRDNIDRDLLIAALLHVYGDSAKMRGGWADIPGIADEFFDPSNDLTQMCRWYLNQIVAPTEAIIDLTSMVRVPDLLKPGDIIALGFDGSDSGDCTALYACRFPDFLIVELGAWENNGRPGWRVDRAEVDAKVRQANEMYRCVRGYFDPPLWSTEIDTWHGDFGDAVLRFPHSSSERIGPACERFSTMAKLGQLKFSSNDTGILAHLANGRRAATGSATKGYWRPARKTEGQPIDRASAAISAVDAMGKAIELGLTEIEYAPAGASTVQTVDTGDLYRPRQRLNI